MMLLRHSTLVIQYLPTHPQFKDPESQKAFRPIKKRLKAVLLDLEQLKPEIERDYEEWIRMAPPPIQREPSAETLPSYESFAAQDPTLSGNVKILDASENQELAVDLARQDTRRRDKARRATVQAGISDEDAQSRRMAGRWEDWDAQMPMSNDVGLQAQMEAARRTLDAANEGRSHESPSSPVSTHNYSYPSVSKSRPVDLDVARPPSYTSFEDQPSRPPKELERPFSQLRFDDREQIPEGPTKAPLQNYESLVPHTTNNRNGPPRPPPKLSDRQPLKPPKERLTFKPGAYLENGDPIRSLFLPKHLRLKFLDKARKNTEAGLEMCGILCGRPVNNALFVSCLLIPDQICTTDTCETENESSMFDYMDKQELLTVGWIHTHPTQTCFMSSRDLHTHAGYQVMMKESVAIVCAPRSDPSYVTPFSTSSQYVCSVANANDCVGTVSLDLRIPRVWITSSTVICRESFIRMRLAISTLALPDHEGMYTRVTSLS